MKKLDVKKATAPLSQYAAHLESGPVILTRNGVAVAALIDIRNADAETLSLSSNPQFLAIIERSRARHKSEGGVSSEEVRRRFGLPARARRRRP